MNRIELLAPAGTPEALKAAVETGANAVYLAGNHFGARAYAGNFNEDDLKKAVTFAHMRDVRVHVTVNTIVNDDEMSTLAEYLKFLLRINVDAILVQDLGVASLAMQVVPEMSLHASTQMTVHSLEGVKALERLGFERVVLSRELSLDEIRNICANSSAEIEVFMHGALCVCYSGQCLMSSMIGARSGNRGQCAQPCRLPYELVDDKSVDVLKDNAGKYLLSPKDLNTIELLPELIEAGVSSLKIEGRMKRPEYVAVVVETYRKAIDRYYEERVEYQATVDERRNLAQIFNRDFTTAYLERNQGRNMISDKRPNNRGVPIGRIATVGKDYIEVHIPDNTIQINQGDQLEIWVKVGGRVTVTVKDFAINSSTCTIKTSESIRGVKVHDRVFKVFDAALTAHARKYFTSADPIRKIPIVGKVSVKLGEPLKLCLATTDMEEFIEMVTNFIAEPAKTRPLTIEVIDKQLKRLGNSVFELKDCQYDIDDNVMVPLSEINDVRRRAIKQLEDRQLARMKAQRPNLKYTEGIAKVDTTPYVAEDTSLIVHIDTVDRLKLAISAGADAILFGGDSYRHEELSPAEYGQAIKIVHLAGKKIYIATPRIVRNVDQPVIEEVLTAIEEADAVYVHNIATLNLARRLTSLPIHTDYSLIAFNLETVKYLKCLGVEGVTLSPELTFEQIKSLTKNSPLPVECIVHGRAELMTSSYCTIGSFLGGVGEHKCSQPCKRQHFFLRDRKAAIFPIVTDQFCRVHILNAKPLSMLPYAAEFKRVGVSAIRIDGRAMTATELTNTVKDYRRALQGEQLTEPENFDFTRGHYFCGVTSKN